VQTPVVQTGVVVDATQDTGIVLLATFLPAVAAAGGVRRTAGVQQVTTYVSIDFDAILPICWMAQVQRTGDLAPNQLGTPYYGGSDEFELVFPGELVVSYGQGAWKLPSYDGGEYGVTVGFGIGTGLAAWGYSVPCLPQQSVPMKAGGYQFVRSGGDETIGDPIPGDLDTWAMPLGFQYLLTFKQDGTGVLT
jgi:hypothetical protein